MRGTRYINSNISKLRFDASEKKIYIGKKVTLLAQKVERLTFSKGKLNIAEFVSKPEHPVVHVDLQDWLVGYEFSTANQICAVQNLLTIQ